MTDQDQQPEAAPEPEEWRARPGEPVIGAETIMVAGRERYVVLKVRHPGGTSIAVSLRGAVACWLGEQLVEEGRKAQSRIEIPTNGDAAKLLRQPGDRN